MSSLSSLAKITKIVADTGDLSEIKRLNSIDVTTNPSLILKTLEKGESEEFKVIEDSLKSRYGGQSLDDSRLESCLLYFSVQLGLKILQLVPGRVSIEVPSCYSFDIETTSRLARKIIEMFEESGVDRKRILIKVAATYEGIMAAKTLETEGIHCNLTLIFSKYQAILCADYGVTLVSPFVGRIYDWYKVNDPDAFAEGDPGVRSVTSIYQYFKEFGYQTEVMGASFRNMDQILGLAGCDLLTISPALLNQLEERSDEVERLLDPNARFELSKVEIDEDTFRFRLKEDRMADQKLREGIEVFDQDFEKQKELMRKILS